jgi:hypothetical protein
MASPRSVLVAVLPAILFGAGCVAERSPEDTLIEFTRAIQANDAAGLYCLSAGAAGSESLGADANERREGFARWLDSELLIHDEAGDEGQIELTGQGVRLTKLFSLGSGTFYQEIGREAVGEDGLVLRTRLDLAYSQIDLSGLSPGTRFYLAGAPVGQIVRIVVPAGARDIRVEALETVMLDWMLLREEALDGCPAGYKIASVEPVEGSTRTRSFTWAF